MEIAIGLVKTRFASCIRDSARAVGQRLVLQRALAALVADRAVERVVEQQELQVRRVAPSRPPGELSWVRTTMPSATVWVQEACGLGIGRPPISTSTRHCRQAPTGSSSGWSQNRGMAVPIRSAARMTSSPFGASTVTPSMVSRTCLPARRQFASRPLHAPGAGCRRHSLLVPFDGRFSTWVTSALLTHAVRSATPSDHRRRPTGHQVLELGPEVLEAGQDRRGRGIAERAERAAGDVAGGVGDRARTARAHAMRRSTGSPNRPGSLPEPSRCADGRAGKAPLGRSRSSTDSRRRLS